MQVYEFIRISYIPEVGFAIFYIWDHYSYCLNTNSFKNNKFSVLYQIYQSFSSNIMLITQNNIIR